MPDAPLDPTLLAVDLGLRCGIAAFDHHHNLLWYRSIHFKNRASLKRGIYSILKSLPNLDTLVTEGERSLHALWAKQAIKLGATSTLSCHAHHWRELLLPPKNQRSGAIAKRCAIEFAHHAIDHLGATKPTSTLRHDTAEAILIGIWGMYQRDWLDDTQLLSLQDAMMGR